MVNPMGGGDNTPKVEGVHAVMYVGKGLDLNQVGQFVGTYGTTMGSTSHDVFDVPLTALHAFVVDNIPDTIASDPDFTLVRLYVPRSRRGQITDIGIMNGAYKAPRHPHVPRSRPIYTAPADPQKYRSRAPARKPRPHQGVGYRDQANGWQPGPGDRFKVTEIT